MTQVKIEEEILRVLSEEKTAMGVSDKLFTPDGLFSHLASNEDERRIMVNSHLFKLAQKRFRELQFKEADEFQRALSNMKGTDIYAMKMERSRIA